MIRRLLPLTLAGFLLACGGAADSEPAAEEAAPTATTATAPAASTPAIDAATGAVVADAPEALQFSAPLLGGGDIELATLAGRPVLLWFWAPW